MLSFLFIGVGGSGGETVRYTMRELDRQLRRAGWESGLPAAWQFMHVDVRQQPDDVKANIPIHLRDRLVHVPLTAYPLTFADCATKVSAIETARDGLAGWWPDPSVPQTKIYDGAGQRRAVGRVTALARMGEFSRPLEDAITALSSGEARTELEALGQRLLAPPRGIDQAPGRVVVVSSLGGGSGSGTFLDIIQYLRASALGDSLDWLSNAVSVLYAPDVFDKAPEHERRGIDGNSLAAMSELLSSFLVDANDPMDPSQAALLSAAGGAATLVGNVGPAATLLVGRSNGKIEYGSAGEVFQAVGKTLATFAFDPGVQSDFDAYLGSNWFESSPPAQIPIMQGKRPNPTSSFGFASVSLGRNLFAEYAAERLANRALIRLRSGHKEGQTTQHVREETLIAARADVYETNIFLPASGLWELGPDRNQVLDALRGDGLSARLDELQRSFLSKEISTAELRAEEWQSSFTNSFNSVADKFSGDERISRNQRAQVWVGAVQANLLECTVDSVVRNGIPVTIELLKRLDGQIEQAEQELQLEAEKYTQRAAGFLQAVTSTFASLTGRARRKLVGDPDSPTFTESARHRRSALADRLEVDLRDLACRLLADLRNNLLPAVVAAVSEMANSLEMDLAQPEVKAAVSQWSVDDVGTHLRPTPNEFLLEKVEEFPAALDDLLRAQMECSLDEAISDAVEAFLRGGWKSATAPTGGPQTLVDTRLGRPWVTAVPEALPPNEIPQAAVLSAYLTAAEILERARDWVHNATGPIKDYVDQTLAGWLNPESPHPDQASALRTSRGNVFARNVDSALAASRPLVSISSTLLHDVHGVDSVGVSLSVSPIPLLNPSDPVRAKLTKSFSQAGVEKTKIDSLFGESASDSVELVSFLGAAVHPIVFSSFATSIQQAWTTRGATADGAASFWAFKRARPLTSFVPLSPALQRALVRGWITARLLNLIAAADPSKKLPVRLLTPAGPKAFPSRLLTPLRSEDDLLPALLETLPMAMIAYSTGDRASLDAYFGLIELGSEDTTDTSPSTALRQWIRAGEQAVSTSSGAKKAPAPLPDTAGTARQSAQERRTTLLSSIKSTTDFMADLAETDVSAATLCDLSPLYEIHELVADAASDVAALVSALAIAPDELGSRHSKGL